MGTRVHKCVGYGLECDTNKYFDLNYNFDSTLFNKKISDKMGKVEIEKIFKSKYFKRFFFDINGIEVDTHYLCHLHGSLISPVSLISVHTADNDIGLILTMDDKWYRYDDIIDYLESPSYENKFVRIWRDGIYPYGRGMICGDNCVSGEKFQKMHGGEYNRKIGKWSENENPTAKDEILESFLKDWRTILPIEIIFSVFINKNIKNKYKLLSSVRPCLATWWC